MSLAATRDAIYRALAAADDGKDRPYKLGEKYEYQEGRQAWITIAADHVLMALGELKREPKRPAAKPEVRKGKAKVVWDGRKRTKQFVPQVVAIGDGGDDDAA